MASQPVNEAETEPEGDRRRDGRFVTIFRAGKITHDGEEQLCMLRNISANGAMINHNGQLAVDDPITLDLRCDERIEGRVAWIEGDRCGIAFLAPADLDRLLARHGADRFKPRPPRLKLEVDIKLQLEGRLFDATLCNVSQNGACIRCELPLPRKPELRVVLPGLGDYRAIVRWRRGKLMGVGFASVLPMWGLNDWVRAARNRKAAAAL